MSQERLPARVMPRLRSLRTYLIALSLAVLVPALAIGTWAVSHAIGSYRAAYEARLRDTARALASAVQSEIEVVQAALIALAASPLLDEGATAEELSTFHARARDVADVFGAWIVLRGPAPAFEAELHTRVPFGTPVAAGPTLPPEHAPLPRVFATGQTAVGGIAQGRVAERPVGFVFVPVVREG
ncbi:MAG TPA: hypothetical protein VD970_13225, partial [Acetobacteraceae bacterium]|nr:hypothetical protein [Acetobacteraceae bacterium]